MKIEIVNGDITKMVCGAIVNSANPALLPGGGVSGAIHRAGGPELTKAAAAHGWCHTGQSVATSGYDLLAEICIHTVGPVWRGGSHGEAILLKDAYQSALGIADNQDVTTIAFPLISAGIYGYPLVDACVEAIKAITDYPRLNGTDIETVYIVVMDERIETILRDLVKVHEYFQLSSKS